MEIIKKLREETPNSSELNLERLASILPSVITEKLDSDGKLKKVVDFDKLHEVLGDHVLEENSRQERYEFVWPGKRNAIREYNDSINKTFLPLKEKSKNWDDTENIYIEGDNLDALKILRKSYQGKIDTIYIDPPYNTGRDFIYKDNRTLSKEDYDKLTGREEDGEIRFVENSESNGRYHSDWCSMMYPRLQLARDLLSEDGVIFISIDEHELHNMINLCNECFGESNYVFDCVRKTKSTTNDAKTGVNYQHEFLLVYAKNMQNICLLGGEKNLKNYKNPDNDPNGDWTSADPSAKSGTMENNYFPVRNPYTGNEDYPPVGRYWAFSKNTLQNHIDSGKICFKKEYSNNERGFIYKRYKSQLQTTKRTFDSLMFTANDYMNQKATKELKKYGLAEYFQFPKGVKFIKDILTHSTNKNSIVLDFFSGSATTADAVLNVNAEDGGNRKFILVQIPEKYDKDEFAYKKGFKNLCDTGEERIRRAGDQILKEHKNTDCLDIGFRVFKISSLNKKDIEQQPQDLIQSSLFEQVSNIKKDRSPYDLFVGSIVDLGLPLNDKMSKITIDKKELFIYGEYNEHINPILICCFEKEVSKEAIKHISDLKPEKVVFKDSCFSNTEDKLNVLELFKAYNSKIDWTERVRVI